MGGKRATWWFDEPDPIDRRAWACPAGHGEFNGLQLDYLDLDDEDERQFLIEAEHPEMATAADAGRETMVIRGQEVSPGTHLAIHRVALNRLWGNEPPEMWLTAQRLTEMGYERHVVLHMLMSVISNEVYAALSDGEPLGADEVRRQLEALPAGWPSPERAVPH